MSAQIFLGQEQTADSNCCNKLSGPTLTERFNIQPQHVICSLCVSEAKTSFLRKQREDEEFVTSRVDGVAK
jgi:hypothetical protein